MKNFIFIFLMMFGLTVFAQNEVTLDSVSVVSFYSNGVNTGSKIDYSEINKSNVMQEPSNVFRSMPSIFSLNDNGTEYGYGYFRIRGLDQTRINVTLDGCPWNEAEDFGTYFANIPNLMGSLNSIKLERGASASYNGIAGVAGGIGLESIDIYGNHESSAEFGAGSWNTFVSSAAYNMKPINGWGLHIRGSHSQTDGFRDNGYNNSTSFNIKTGYKFNDKHSIDIMSVTGYHRNGQGWLGNTIEELAINKHANGNVNANGRVDDDEFFTSMNRILYKGWVKDNVLLTSAVYWQHQTGSYRMDLDNYMYRMADPTWLPGTTNALYDYALQYNMIGGNVATKVYLNDFTFTGGVNLYNYNRRHWLGSKSENVDWSLENYDNNGNKFDIAPFVIGKYDFNKHFTAIANVQYRFVNFTYKDNLNPVIFNSNDLGTRWNFCNFGVGLEYKPIDNTKIYTRFNYVNREPTRTDMFGGNEFATVNTNNVVEISTSTPEVARDVELGIEHVSNAVKFNVNAFYMNFKNELVLNGEYGLNGLPNHDNAKSSVRSGIEAAVDWNVYDKLHFINNGSWSYNKVNTDTYGKVTHILSPSVTWNTDLTWNDKMWYAGANWNYRSSMYVDMENTHKIPERWTLNIYGAYRFANNLELGLKVNNITNKTNYCTGAVGANNETLYFREGGTNFMTTVKMYF